MVRTERGPASASIAAPGVVAQWNVALFDRCRLRRARTEIRLHRREQRLIALLALQGDRPRGYVAGVLWPESTERRAVGNLRAAVWQTDQEAPGLLLHDRSELRLNGPVRFDVEVFTRCALRIFGWRDGGPSLDRGACMRSLPVLLRGELLPGWYDDWVIYERTRLTQLRQQALELLADLLVDRDEIAAALVAASAAVSIEPLHEPATRALIRARMQDADYSGALRDYEAYRLRVLTELGVPPSGRLDALVRPLLERRRATGRRTETRSVVA
jgi:DNA-binding SARP family transcriptional activator